MQPKSTTYRLAVRLSSTTVDVSCNVGKKSLNGDVGGDIRVLHVIECAMRARSLFGLRWQKNDPTMRR